MQRILDAAFFFVEINIFFGRLAGERIECCKNDIIDDNLYCKNDRISADMLYLIQLMIECHTWEVYDETDTE